MSLSQPEITDRVYAALGQRRPPPVLGKAARREADKRARFARGHRLLDTFAAELRGTLADRVAVVDCTSNDGAHLRVLPLATFDAPPALAAALATCPEGCVRGLVIVPGDWQVRALAVRPERAEHA